MTAPVPFLKTILILLLLLLIGWAAKVGPKGWYDNGNYAGWGLATAIMALAVYLIFRR